ncbi:RraA family protein [Pectobacterium aquaticum]|uniref:RraA family protein n=1 Tax=Pectobacterium aquaticum TaxID=2204145 RepID=UPI000E283DF7|nr:RraA family protein [Pectobacterium aquaticum]RRO07644.1 RraA family protein [Pectobacterium aquaticum]UEM39396.1 RraA family protein [Pectobacterium aquaticum]
MNKELLLQAGTATVSDALDMLNINNGLGSAINPLQFGMRCVGPAFTLQVEAVQPGESGKAADYIDDVAEGDVIIIANRGVTEVTVWGDILSRLAVRKGIAGTVIDGSCRDADGIAASGYPVFSRAVYMKSGKGRTMLKAINVPVNIGETTVTPGDIICADSSGVVVIPQDKLAQVEELVSEILTMETQVEDLVEKGMTLKAAREKLNYNRYGLKAG